MYRNRHVHVFPFQVCFQERMDAHRVPNKYNKVVNERWSHFRGGGRLPKVCMRYLIPCVVQRSRAMQSKALRHLSEHVLPVQGFKVQLVSLSLLRPKKLIRKKRHDKGKASRYNQFLLPRFDKAIKAPQRASLVCE